MTRRRPLGKAPGELFVITGSSGTGKTRLLDALRMRGHTCFDEPVRRTLREQIDEDGPALPAKDPRLFVAELLRQFVRDLETARSDGTQAFFDRGVPDVVAYAIRFGVETAALEDAVRRHRYHERVFVLPPWREIFVNDDLRGATYEDYLEFHVLIARTYERLGYTLVEVPKGPVEMRADFLEATVERIN